MLSILVVTFPFFALVLCGFGAARRRMLPLEAIPGLNAFVLYFALPCMLFRFGASMPLSQLADASVLLTYLLCALLTVAFVIAVTLGRTIRWNDASFGALVGAFPNTGFMGVPLLVALLGPEAAGPTMVALLVDLVITTSLCIALSRLDVVPVAPEPIFNDMLGQSNGPVPVNPMRQAARKALWGVLTNPMPWAILAGALLSAFDLVLYGPVAKTVGLLADAASPVALFTIGAVLARSQMMGEQGEHAPIPWTQYVPVALVKLVFHPLLVLMVGAALIHLGLPLGRFPLIVIVLVAALPSASNVSLLSERFGANTGRIARIILVSTSAAFFTFSAAVALLKPT